MNKDENTTLNLKKFAHPKLSQRSVPGVEETLSGLVVEAVNQATSEAKGLQQGPAGPVPNKTVLEVLTYCYAKGTYGSGEIAEKLSASPEMCRATGDALPDGKALRRFRRFNRNLLQASLEKALRLIRRALIRRTMSQTLPGSEPSSVSKVTATQPAFTAPGEETTIVVHREAQQKLENAALMDKMLDD